MQLQLQNTAQAEALAYKLEVLNLPATINQNNLQIEFQNEDSFIISKLVENLKQGVK